MFVYAHKNKLRKAKNILGYRKGKKKIQYSPFAICERESTIARHNVWEFAIREKSLASNCKKWETRRKLSRDVHKHTHCEWREKIIISLFMDATFLPLFQCRIYPFFAYTNKFTMTLHFSYLTFFLLLSKYKWRHSILMKYFYYLNKIYAGNFMNKQYVLCAFKSSKIKQNHL